MKNDWLAHGIVLSRVKGHFSPFSQAIPRPLESNGFPCALCYYWNDGSILQSTKDVGCYVLKWYVFGTPEIKKKGTKLTLSFIHWLRLFCLHRRSL